MIVKINDTNVGDYGKFLSKAYKYLELLEWHRAYQFLLKNNVPIQEVDIDNYNIVDADKTFFDRTAFKRYEFDGKVRRYDDSVYIIAAEDRDEQNNAFSTIEQYFNYIEVIKASNRAEHFLLSLPLDEGILSIDANTRTITIPPTFVSTVIQKDTYAETIVFTIDRFVDNIDLASNDFEIYVQWSGLDDKGKLREEASVIELKDLVDGKIKFGWILSEEVTRYPGNINFSIVFFKRNDETPGLLDFRLNTLPQTLTIQPALQSELNSQSEAINATSNLFKIVRNNKYPGKGVEAPKDPTFAKERGGFDLENNDPSEGTGATELLEFKAQAVVPDNGSIDYTWWFWPEGCERVYNCSGGTYKCEPGTVILPGDYNRLNETSQGYFSATNDDKGNPISYTLQGTEVRQLTYDAFGEIYKLYSLIEDDDYMPQDVIFVNEDEDAVLDSPTVGEDGSTIINYTKELYVKVDTNTIDTFRKYSGEPELDDQPKYEKFMVLRTPADKSIDIIGQYSITAVNTKPGRHSETGRVITQESRVVSSTGCDVKGPIEIEFNTNMDSINYIRQLRTLEMQETLTQDDYTKLLNSLEFEEDKKKLEFGESDATEKNIIYDSVSKIYTVKTQIPNLRIKYKELKVDLKETTGDLSYEWYKGDTRETATGLISGAKNDTYIATEPGWYKVKVSAKKNRRIHDKTSDAFRAVFMPRPFTLSIDRANSSNFPDTPYLGVYQLDAEDNAQVKLAVDASLMIDNVEKFNKTNQTGNDLYTDAIEYKWYKYVENGGQHEMTLQDLAAGSEASLNSPMVIVTPDKTTEYFYKCVAINHLGEQVSAASNAIVFSVV